MCSLKVHSREECFSDSTLTGYSSSIDLLKKRPLPMRSLNFGTPIIKTNKKPGSKTKPRFNVSRKQCSLHRRKQTPSNYTLCMPSLFINKQKRDQDGIEVKTKNYCNITDEDLKNANYNQVKELYPVRVEHSVPSHSFSDKQSFPFKNTPSGNYKLDPSQVIYESKNLSIVAADPKSITLNVAESSKNTSTNSPPQPDSPNWATTCLFSAASAGSKIPFHSDLSETFSESDDNTLRAKGKRAAELSLSKMGYVTDNCVDWKKLQNSLPNKSDLQQLLLKHILSTVHPDIKIKIGDTVYMCHRIVLLCYSTYFVSNADSVVELPEKEVKKEAFSLIYKWMLYVDEDSFSLLRRDNILDILQAARFLKVKELEHQCWSFIDNADIFSEDQAFLLYLDARSHGNKDVMDLMVPKIQRFFLTLVSSKEFVEFSCEEVCTFLRSNFICVRCELEIFMAAVRWLMHDWPERMQYTVQVMQTIRFAHICPAMLLTVWRGNQSPEFTLIGNIREVTTMIMDGIVYNVLKVTMAGKSKEEFEKNLNLLKVTQPLPRNWAETEKNYENYSDFLQELSLYRSKQRLENKRSRIKIEIDKVDRDDFLSSAVLPPASQQKIKMLHGCLPLLEGKEFNMIKKMICEDQNKDNKNLKTKLMSFAEKEYSKNAVNTPYVTKKQKRNQVVPEQLSIEELNRAASKIQKAYRNHYQKNRRSIVVAHNANHFQEKHNTSREGREHKKTQKNNMSKLMSQSDPSLTLNLLRSSTGRKYMESNLPLRPGKETVFIFGGTDLVENGVGQKIIQYTMKSNRWKKCGEMPEARHFHSAIFFKGKIYIAGGKNPAKSVMEGTSQKVWMFDPDYKAWSRVSDMIHARRSFNLVALGDWMFAIGGRDMYNRAMANVERYDPVTKKWTEVRSMTIGRAGAAACQFNCRIWVAGGLIDENNAATGDVECYDCRYDRWEQIGELRFSTAYGVLLTVRDELFLVGGAIGLLHSDQLQGGGKHIDVWNQDLQMWCSASTMNKPRHAHAAVCLKEGDGTDVVFILGGYSTRRESAFELVECWRENDDSFIPGIPSLPYAVTGHAALALPHDIFG